MLIGMLALYTSASFLHFAHNAEFLGEYPNLPDSITRFDVYASWFGLVAIGLSGLTLYLTRWRRAGLALLGVYAALGLDGLLHYTRAPVGEHTAMMNFTIWFEVGAAVALMLVTWLAFSDSSSKGEAET